MEASGRGFLLLLAAMVFLLERISGEGDWLSGHASFYGETSGKDTMYGACRYGDTYNLETAAVSAALFRGGAGCGACFQLRCANSTQYCFPGSITLTAADACPANHGDLCKRPLNHFDLAVPTFKRLADSNAGVVAVLFRRVPCSRAGGVKFELAGNPFFLAVTVHNVGGAGDVTGVAVKGTTTEWLAMERIEGARWGVEKEMLGQGLSFRVTAGDGKMLQFDDVVPRSWYFGIVYEGKGQF